GMVNSIGDWSGCAVCRQFAKSCSGYVSKCDRSRIRKPYQRYLPQSVCYTM
ncbi:hypothetical protein AVDCRST_MAG81-4681, partial [uncultured Synechococcales cyanobacterium]